MFDTKYRIDLSAFSGKDDIELFANATAYLKEHPDTTLVVPPRTYVLTSELARDQQQKVMNGEFGGNPQRIMFNPKYEYTRGIHLDGLKNCRLEAYGSLFLVDGFMEPVSITNCENVEVCGFAIDHKRKPYSRAIVTELERAAEGELDSCILRFDDECPLTPNSPMHLRNHFYDKYERRRVEAYVEEAEFVDSHHIRARVTKTDALKNGTEYYVVHTFHSRPAILIEYSKDTYLTDVTIHSQPGMGVVGNRSENIIATRLNVTPSQGHHMSTNTDGTHFTSIKGLLRMQNCNFYAQGDDFVNVHGYFHAVVKRDAPNICYLQEKTPDGTHSQSLDYPDVGDLMELTSHSTLEVLDTLKVVAVETMPDEWMCRVTFDHDLPEDTTGLMLADITRLPEVEVLGCSAAEHFARSILIKSRKALIENNILRDIRGTAIAVAAESYWFEGVCPSNVIIRNNVIIDTSHSSDKTAGIYIKADCGAPKGQSIHNVVVENNVIYAPNCKNAIYARNVEGLYMKNNICTTLKEPIQIEDSTNIKLS